MDYEDLEESLRKEYNQWCRDNGYIPNPDTLDRFIDEAINRIEEFMLGGMDIDEAYEEYRSEMYSDMEYVREEYE